MWTSLSLGVDLCNFKPGNVNYYTSRKPLLCHFSGGSARFNEAVPVVFLLLHVFGKPRKAIKDRDANDLSNLLHYVYLAPVR